MSGPLELYRTTVNLRGLGSGAEIEIDPTDPRWAGDIAARRVVPVARIELAAAVVKVIPADGSEPFEVKATVESFEHEPDWGPLPEVEYSRKGSTWTAR